ncbi:aminoglycoside adenylyltransferase domain-containing protein [Paenibacillus filicis]|uniref:Aminoglycoside adenylyltransferase domain-containing protein n=1 Tax=Paenibacillus filicis TaxID=669464 RepID=A0ABU9DFV0_9BACL
MMKEKVPCIVYPLLHDYAEGMKLELPTILTGIYLHGSICLNEFHERRSDVDLITVVNRPIQPTELEQIIRLHERLKKKYELYARLEEQFTCEGIISGSLLGIDGVFPRFAEGMFRGCTNGYIDSTALWLLKKQGIALYGKPISELNLKVSWQEVIDTMKFNLHTYWTGKVKDRGLYMHEEWIEFGVLTLCRIIYTLEHQSIVPKRQAGEFALNFCSNEWNLIIAEALRIREAMHEESFFASVEARADAAQAFIRYGISYCNNRYGLLRRETSES